MTEQLCLRETCSTLLHSLVRELLPESVSVTISLYSRWRRLLSAPSSPLPPSSTLCSRAANTSWKYGSMSWPMSCPKNTQTHVGEHTCTQEDKHIHSVLIAKRWGVSSAHVCLPSCPSCRGVTLGSVPGDTSTMQVKDNRPSFRMSHMTRTYGAGSLKLSLTQQQKLKNVLTSPKTFPDNIIF